MQRLAQLAEEHNHNELRCVEAENRLREEINHHSANSAGQAFIRSVRRMPTRMTKHKLVLDRPDMKPTALTRTNQMALSALRNAGKGRQLRADYQHKKWAANIPSTEYYGRQVSRDQREEVAFDENEARALLNVRAL